MPDETPEDTLQKIETSVLGLVLARIAVRGRLRIEQDLRDLEQMVGGELPEVRSQLAHLFGFGESVPALPAPAAAELSPRRGPGRPKKPREDGPDEAP